MSCTYDEKSKVWSANPLEPIFNYKNSLGQILHHQLSLFANKVIQIDDTQNRSITGQEAQIWGVRIAQKLKKMQLNHNHVVGISAQNSTYVLPIALGCFFNATPFHSVNSKLDKITIEHCFGLTKPAIIFCDGSDYEVMLEATKSFKPIIYTITEYNGSVPSIEELLKPTETEKHYQPERLVMGIQQTVAVLCSSGTTGKPKAVLISAPSILFDLWFTSSDSCFYSASGLDWFTGLMFMVSSCIRGFTRLIFSRSYDTQDFLQVVAKYKVTEAFLSSRYLATLIQDPCANQTNLASLRSIAFGGSALTETSLNKIRNFSKNKLDLAFFYGMTEVGVVSYRRGNSDKPKSVGKIIENTKIRIVDDNGENLQHNKVGEIFVKTSRPWNGYYGNPDETKRVLDSQGWFHTGDVGYMDADNDLFIVDRKKEILKYQGLHYSPSEIEDAIGQLSGIQDFCVASVFDDTKGDVAGALVVKKPGSKLTPQDVIGHVKKRLVAEHKQLHAGVYFVDNIPQNFNGKVLKKEASAVLKQFAMHSMNNKSRMIS